MKQIIYASAIFLMTYTSCKSGNNEAANSDTLQKQTAETVATASPSFEGTWKVVAKTENMYNNENGELLKGPFVDSTSNIQLVLKSDSLFSKHDGKTTTYSFTKNADGSLDATNISSKEKMTFTIDSVTQTHLYFTNTRVHLKDKFVVNMKCVKE